MHLQTKLQQSYGTWRSSFPVTNSLECLSDALDDVPEMTEVLTIFSDDMPLLRSSFLVQHILERYITSLLDLC